MVRERRRLLLVEVRMKITSKGQLTIPQAIREELGLFPETEVEFEISGTAVLVRKMRTKRSRGNSIVARLRGSGDVKMSTDQIMALTRR
jgi:AbrB family looped-hinge helix DNA binding protein